MARWSLMEICSIPLILQIKGESNEKEEENQMIILIFLLLCIAKRYGGMIIQPYNIPKDREVYSLELKSYLMFRDREQMLKYAKVVEHILQ